MENQKRIDVVSIQLVKEKSVLCEYRQINNPANTYKLLKDFLADSDRERFIVVCLNKKNEPINICTIGIGTVNHAIVSPFDVMKPALLSGSQRIILAHNHPSGDPNPSTDDFDITERMRQAGEILGIEVVDHIIIAGNKCFSFLIEQLMFCKELNNEGVDIDVE